jgi:hypothetical protein
LRKDVSPSNNRMAIFGSLTRGKREEEIWVIRFGKIKRGIYTLNWRRKRPVCRDFCRREKSCIRVLLEGNLSPELLTKVLEYLGVDNTLVDEMLAQSLDHFHLLFRSESSNGGLDDTANRGLVDGDETTHSQF